MRYIETFSTERVGYDFYCDIANRIVQAREMKGLHGRRSLQAHSMARGCMGDVPRSG